MHRLVLEDIRRHAAIATHHSRRYMEMLTQASTAKQKQETDRQRRELKKAEKRIAELEKILVKLYEDRALGRISEERYQPMSMSYEAEQRELKEKRQALEAAISQAEQIYSKVENFTRLIRQYTDIKALDAKILNELIDRIVVHEKGTNPDGQKSQQVDIHYKFIGFIPVTLDFLNLLTCPAKYPPFEDVSA